MTQIEFEELVQQLIDGKIENKYHMTIRTINAKITKLATTNPSLYQKFIEKHPFKPKEITHINFVELIKKIMKEELSVSKAAEVYDISTRTLSRRIKEMKDSEIVDELTGLKQREIYQLYKKYMKQDLSYEDEILIESIQVGEVKEKERITDRENDLETILQKYNQLIEDGLSKAQAAKQLGFTHTDMNKKKEELKRIKIEKKVKQEKQDFKRSMRVSKIPTVKEEKLGPKRESIKKERGEM